MVPTPAPLHLAVALDGAGWHPAAWREPDAQPQRLFTAGYWTELARHTERGLLDFLTIEDGLDLQSDDGLAADARTDRVRGRLDAVLIAARAAPATRHIGFVPTAITTHTEPFHLSRAIATLDYVSSGRAGIRVQVAVRGGTAAHFGRREIPPLQADRLTDPGAQRLIADHFDEAADYVEVLRRLWDSWEDDAEIRDVATGRFIDRDKLHYIGRPDTFTILAALAAVTEHVGLTGTINSTFNEPYEVARQFASLDHLSGGRTAWNVVTSWDAFTGENFRRGGYPAQGDRYERAQDLPGHGERAVGLLARRRDPGRRGTGQFLATAAPGAFRHRDAFFDIAGQFNVPRSPQGRPVIFQAGDSDEGRDFAAASADAIFSRHSTLKAGQAFYADVKGRLPKSGRTRGELLILPAATFVLGDTDAEAAEIARGVRRAQVSPQTALKFIEQLWNTELSGFDVDGPLPAFDPVRQRQPDLQGPGQCPAVRQGPGHAGRRVAGPAEAGNLSAREVVIEVTGRQSFIGSAETIATTINELVQADAADGYILVPHITPGGLTPFVDQVVPLLQERGVFRADYTGTTLRNHLGLAPWTPWPPWTPGPRCAAPARRRPPGP